MNHAPVSVIIPTYNRAALVAQSIESVLAEIAPGDEVIVVDDGSTDDTQQSLTRYLSSIRYLRVPNGGVSTARNIGISLARHDLIALNDSDDLWLPNHLHLQRQIMSRCEDLVFCFSNFGGLLPDGFRVANGLAAWLREFGSDASVAWDDVLGPGAPFSKLGTLPPGRRDFRVHIGDLYAMQLRLNHVSGIAALIRRSLAGRALHFPEDISFAEDWECFARMSRLGPVAFMDCETALQRVHAGPRLTAIDRARKAAIQLKVVKRVWGADEEFLARNQLLFERTVARIRSVLACALLVQGKTAEARRQLKLAGRSPAAYRALAYLPGPLVKGLLSARRSLMQIAGNGRRKDGRHPPPDADDESAARQDGHSLRRDASAGR